MKICKSALLTLAIATTFSFAGELDEDKMELGKQLYFDTCVSCHGADGKAKTDMKLIVKPRDLTKTLLTEKQQYNIIKDGAKHWGAKADIMPAFKYVFNEEQLTSLAYFTHKNFNPDLEKRKADLLNQCEPEPVKQDAKMIEWGKKIFTRNCQFCHGPTGDGNGIATKSPVDSIFPYNLSTTLLTKEQIFLYVKYGGHYFGTFKKDMPAWQKKYNDFKLHSVAKYVDEVIRGNNKK